MGALVAGTIVVIPLTPLVVEPAPEFGPAEYFALGAFSFITDAAVLPAFTAPSVTGLGGRR